MKRVSMLLIAVALIAGMVGCGQSGYNLTIASTAGGSVTTPGEGTFTYDEGTVVILAAKPDEGYQFANWTGDVNTITDVEDGTTTITMNGDYTITANFVQSQLIRTWYDLDAIKDNMSGSYILMNDLDCTTAGYTELASPTANGEKGWQPIGTQGNPFTGIFDGHGYEIRDLFIDRPDEDYVGLFGYVQAGTIEGIGVAKATVAGDDYVGGLVGLNNGAVINCYSTANVTGQQYVGSLMGLNQSGDTVSNSYYDYDEGLINGEKMITVGALYHEDFEQWLANNEFLDVDERLSRDDGYYLINDINDFKQLLIFGQNSSLKFRLTSDLDLVDEPNFYIPYLAGEFDGNGHKICNLNLNCDSFSLVGLFGFLAFDAKVTRVGLENINITGHDNIGGLVAMNLGTVSSSYSTGSVIGNNQVGILVGVNHGTVENCYATGSVTGMNCVGILVGYNLDDGLVTNSYSTGGNTTGNSVGGVVGWNCGAVTYSYSTGGVAGDYFVGGVVGHNYGTVTYSYSTGSVAGNEYVGGVVGHNHEGSVSDSYATGNVTGKLCVGGLAGANDKATIANCYFTGSVTGEGQVGGLVGGNWGTVRGCYSTGSVTGKSRVGGLGGGNHGTVENSYATGGVTGIGRVGGLVGDDSGGTVEDSYATGSVTGTGWVGGLVGSCFMSTVSSCYAVGNVTREYDYFVGGLVGFNDCSIVSRSFWDMETSGQTTSAGGMGKTTAEMQDIATFSGAGWSIMGVANSSTRNTGYQWNIVGDETYPFLSWQSVV